MTTTPPEPAIHAVASTLIEALPFMRRYQGAVMVIKYGGHAMGDETPRATSPQDIVLLKQVGHQPGRGPRRRPADQARCSSGSASSRRFVDGLRVTDAATVEVVEMVLAGTINKEIVSCDPRPPAARRVGVCRQGRRADHAPPS